MWQTRRRRIIAVRQLQGANFLQISGKIRTIANHLKLSCQYRVTLIVNCLIKAMLSEAHVKKTF